MRSQGPVGGRREIAVQCANCSATSVLPGAAIVRNNFFCSTCGKPMDLSGIFRQFQTGEATTGRREKDSKYKSARKSRR